MTSIKRNMTLSLACGAVLALALGSIAFATHARTGGGSPFRAPLVLAYNQCAGAATVEDPAPSVVTNTHVAPLANPSCAPQVQKSSTHTMSTTGTGLGTVSLVVFCTNGEIPPCPAAGSQEDIRLTASGLTAVTCRVAGAGASGGCAGAGTLYNGLLLASSVIRITDHSNAAPPNDTCAAGSGAAPCVTATVSDLTFTVPMACGSAGGQPAGTCIPAAATINSLLPGAVKELQRGNVEIQNIRVTSPGPDFNFGPCPPCAGTPDDEKYLTQGIFLP